MKLEKARILIAGTGSGSGKTTLTAGILKCLKNRGLRIASFKCGPDYIDPMFHSRITGCPSGTLDPFFCEDNMLRSIMALESGNSDVAVAEGVMGYYDGIGFTSQASTWSVARATGTPVVLVVSCRGISASAEAVLRGFLGNDPGGSMIRGVIFNQLSPRLAPQAMRMAERLGVRPVGFLPVDRRLTLESRHLGLVKADEIIDFDERADRIGEMVETYLDMELLLKLAQEAEALEWTFPGGFPKWSYRRDDNLRIAVAKDQAFNFIYRENIGMLEQAGCEIVYFSPLEHKELPEGIDGLILSGGYPELYAGRLSANQTMRDSVRNAISSGLPTLAECGGFLYLHDVLEGSDGVKYPMAGVVMGECFDRGTLGRFGYIEVTAEKDGLLCEKGSVFRAHEFHYWDSTDPGSDFTALKPDGSRSWKCGYHTDTLYAGFPHLHFCACPEVCRRFVEKCAEYREKQRIV